MSTPVQTHNIKRIRIEFSSSALISNFRILAKQTPGKKLIAMVKADGYGHGAEWVATHLLNERALYGFGVATLEEGIRLRENLRRPSEALSKILVFSGTTPWTDAAASACDRFALTPVLTSADDIERLPRVPFHLKFNTGMNRLGIPAEEAERVFSTLRRKNIAPEGILTHLALGENPAHPLSRKQLSLFESIHDSARSRFPNALFHFANSAAIWKSAQWRLKQNSDLVRPGIALYGAAPWADAPTRGLKAVMRVQAPVIAVHRLRAGDRIGYGATYRAPSAMSVAIVAAGYADGLHRLLSNKGHAWLNGRKRRMIGIVSMDLCAVECPSKTAVGSWVELIGPQMPVWQQARAAGTIPYELMTSVSTTHDSRVERCYV